MDEFVFQVAEEMENERIDSCISMLIDSLSRSFIQKMIKEGRVSVNGAPVKNPSEAAWKNLGIRSVSEASALTRRFKKRPLPDPLRTTSTPLRFANCKGATCPRPLLLHIVL